MKQKNRSFWILISLFALSMILAACNLPSQETDGGNLLPTHVAQTVAANQTEQAAPTPTPQETVASSPTATFTPTPTSTPTQIPVPCDLAVFVEHVTFPAETLVKGGEDFTKTWKVRNAGSCAWSSAYALEFVSGDRMDAPVSAALARRVEPGDTTNLTLFFTAPTSEAIHRGYWALVNDNGVKIPMENTSDGNLSVAVRVNVLNTVAYDFTENYCDARWQSVVAPNLDCPDESKRSANGYVERLAEGILEDGEEVDDPILVTRPDNGDNDGFISGTYPNFKVQAGDYFMATIGCARGANQCNIYFDLQYRVGNGSIKTLETWREVYDGKTKDISVDLSDLAGQNVSFILTVRNNGTEQDNEGYWFDPRIMR